MFTNELFDKAAECESPDELIEFAKSKGIELSTEEALAYLAEYDDVELEGKILREVAGGRNCYPHCSSNK